MKIDHYLLTIAIEDAIIEIYEKYELNCLRGLDLSAPFILHDRDISSWYFKTTKKQEAKYKNQFDYQQNFDDIIMCSDEFLYYTAQLYFYRPFINNPIEEVSRVDGGAFYSKDQNLADKRYNMFADVVSQSAYNYWDKIGNLIASFSQNRINKRQLYFGTVLETIPQEFHSSQNFIWLKYFKEHGYHELNNKRRKTVHFTTSDTIYKYEHLTAINDSKKMLTLQKIREALPEFYKDQISQTLEGFGKTILLLEELSVHKFENQNLI